LRLIIHTPTLTDETTISQLIRQPANGAEFSAFSLPCPPACPSKLQRSWKPLFFNLPLAHRFRIICGRITAKNATARNFQPLAFSLQPLFFGLPPPSHL
jgi:hypothetical protein